MLLAEVDLLSVELREALGGQQRVLAMQARGFRSGVVEMGATQVIDRLDRAKACFRDVHDSLEDALQAFTDQP